MLFNNPRNSVQTLQPLLLMSNIRSSSDAAGGAGADSSSSSSSSSSSNNSTPSGVLVTTQDDIHTSGTTGSTSLVEEDTVSVTVTVPNEHVVSMMIPQSLLQPPPPLLQQPPLPLPQPQPQPPISTTMSWTERDAAELRHAAGGKCHDTFLKTIHKHQHWMTATNIDTMSTTTHKSPLHIAAWKGNIQNLIYFIEILHCNVNVISQMTYSYGKTPIFFAMTQCRKDVVQYLLEQRGSNNNINVKIVNNKGQTPLSIASSHFNTTETIYNNNNNNDDPNNNNNNDYNNYNIIDEIIRLEQVQENMEWINYRTTHYDGCIYGDLDPRFVIYERDICIPFHDDNNNNNNDDDTMVVTIINTPYAINPTTKTIRQSGLYRRINHHHHQYKFGNENNNNNKDLPTTTTATTTTTQSVSQQQQQCQLLLQSTRTSQKRTMTTTTKTTHQQQLSTDDIHRLENLWNELQYSFQHLNSNDHNHNNDIDAASLVVSSFQLEQSLCHKNIRTIVQIHSKLYRAWIPEMVDQLRQLDDIGRRRRRHRNDNTNTSNNNGNGNNNDNDDNQNAFDVPLLLKTILQQEQPPLQQSSPLDVTLLLLPVSATTTTIKNNIDDNIDNLTPKERTLIRRLYNCYMDPSTYRKSVVSIPRPPLGLSVVSNLSSSSSTTTTSLSLFPKNHHRCDIFSDPTWKNAYDIVQHLQIQQLITEDTTTTTATATCTKSMLVDTTTTEPLPPPPPKYITLPYTPIWVDTIEQLIDLQETIHHISLVAIDAEWHDTNDDDNSNHNNNNRESSMLSTLQIAIVVNEMTKNDVQSKNNRATTTTAATMVWVIDLLGNPVHHESSSTTSSNSVVGYRDMCRSIIVSIFQTKIVLGFALSNDIKRLEHYCFYSSCQQQQQPVVAPVPSQPPPQFDKLKNTMILDVQLLWNNVSQIPGLARCVQEVICAISPTISSSSSSMVLLSKEYQCSNWSQRPLVPLQLQYAGLDAVIVLYLLAEQYRLCLNRRSRRY